MSSKTGNDAVNHTHFSRDSFFEITGHTDFRSGIEDVGGATANLIQRFVYNFFFFFAHDTGINFDSDWQNTG